MKVSSLVIIPIPQRGKDFLAVCALEGLLSRVQTHVYLQVRFLYRSLRAKGTLVHDGLSLMNMLLLVVAFESLVASVATIAVLLLAYVLAV